MTGDDDEEDIEDFYRVPGSSSKRTSFGPNAGSYSRGNFNTAPRRGHKAGQGSYSLSTKSHPMSRQGGGRVEDGPSDILFDSMDGGPSQSLRSDNNDRQV